MRGKAKDPKWLNENFQWVYDGFILNRMLPDNHERVKETLSDYFPNFCAHAPLENKAVEEYFIALKTTGTEIERLDHYFLISQEVMREKPNDSAARDALYLDWANFRVQAQKAIEPKSLSNFIKQLPPDGLEKKDYIADEGIVIIKCHTNLIHFLEAPHFPTAMAIEMPGNKPYALIHKNAETQQNVYIRFSSISGLKFQQTFFS